MEFKDLVEINDVIQNELNDDKEFQMFDIDPIYGWIACSEQFKYFVLKCYRTMGAEMGMSFMDSRFMTL